MDLVLKLREIRRLRGLSQKDVARLSGVGEKTISSFETGQRIGSLKLGAAQADARRLRPDRGRVLRRHGREADRAVGADDEENAPRSVSSKSCASCRKPVQKAMVAKFQLMLETATAVDQVKRTDESKRVTDKRPSYVRENPTGTC